MNVGGEGSKHLRQEEEVAAEVGEEEHNDEKLSEKEVVV